MQRVNNVRHQCASWLNMANSLHICMHGPFSRTADTTFETAENTLGTSIVLQTRLCSSTHSQIWDVGTEEITAMYHGCRITIATTYNTMCSGVKNQKRQSLVSYSPSRVPFHARLTETFNPI